MHRFTPDCEGMQPERYALSTVGVSRLAQRVGERTVRALSPFIRSQLRRTHPEVPPTLIPERRGRGEFQRVRHALD